MWRTQAPRRIALFTVVYPGAEPFLGDWYRSVLAQTDRDFKLCIAAHGLKLPAAKEAMGANPEALWVQSEPGETTADIRSRALAQLTGEADAIILVDSDDILCPTRVEAARAALATSDLHGCALRLVDAAGRDTGDDFAAIGSAETDRMMPQWNAFGFSNSAYRAGLLKQCLPIPSAARLIDWLVATRAWLLRARLSFDPAPRMKYRRHGANLAPALGPFEPENIARDTHLVRAHFDLAVASLPSNACPDRSAMLRRRRHEVAAFADGVSSRPDALKAYASVLREMQLPPVWWTSVAHPALSHMWNETGSRQ